MDHLVDFTAIPTGDFTHLSWNTFRSRRFALQYVAIPKAACTALKWWFADLEGCVSEIQSHPESWETDPSLVVHDILPQLSPGMARLDLAAYVQLITQPKQFRFAVVRNPYTRIFSAWQSKLLLQEPRDVLSYGAEDFLHIAPDETDAHAISQAFEHFLSAVRGQEWPDGWLNPHWTPQTRLLYTNLIPYDQIVQVESLTLFMDTLKERIHALGGNTPVLRRFNENPIPYSAAYLTAASIALIQQLYADDFVALGYDPEHIPEGQSLSAEALRTALRAIPLIVGRNQRFGAVRTLLNTEKTEHAQTLEQLQEWQALLQNLAASYQVLSEEQQHLQQHNTELSASFLGQLHETDWFKEQLFFIQHSRSWRLTRPLRVLAGAARRLARGRGPEITTPSAETQQSAVPSVRLSTPERMCPRPRVLPKAVVAASTGLRVLIVTPDIVGPIRNGGIGTAFAALALFAARAGARVSLLYTLGNHSEHWSMADCVAYYAQGAVDFIPLRPSAETPHIDAPWPRRNAYAVYTWLKSHGEDYDLIIFPEWHGEAYYAVVARHQGLMLQHAQIWVNTHGPSVWSMEGNYQLPSEIDLIDLDFMERETVRLADGIVSPSVYLLDWMRGHQWQLPKQALAIQNLMEENCVEDATTRFDVNIIDELIFFGRLEPRKGLIIFCDAIDRLTPIVRDQLPLITFMGKALPVDVFDSITYIEQRAAAWGMPIVIQTEYGREQALAYLTESPSRLAVIASLVENLPYTVLECLHHGIRFLATEIGGIPELIDSVDHVRVLFPPRPAALARLLESAITEGLAPAHRAQMPEQVEAQWQTLFAQITANLRDKPAVPSITPDQMPLVSICMPHHDSPNTLRAALDSIRRQSYPHYEVIVVDDGSSDEQTLTALTALEKEFAQKGGVLIRQENAYPGAARNRAAATAKGEYLLFMDDDNLAMPHELETFVAVARRTNADILTTVSAVFTGKTPPERPKHLWLPLGAATGAGVYRNVFGDTNSFWKQSAFRAVGGFTEDYGIGHEDWEIFAKATLMGLHLELVPEPLFWYRATVGGVQTAGDMAAYHARSARPYLQHDPHGLGMLAAHAAWARFSTALRGSQPNSGKKASFRKALSLIRRPDLYIKFRITIKRYGLKTAIRKSIIYLRNQSG